MSYPLTPDEGLRLARRASEAVRALNHATLSANGSPALHYPSDAQSLLGEMGQLVVRLAQLLPQISAFLQAQLQSDLIRIDDGEFEGDPFGAVGTASYQLEGPAVEAARTLASAIDVAYQAIAFASHI